MRRTQKSGAQISARNKTIKMRCPSKYKHARLVQNILREWKTQTNGKGHIARDVGTIYKCDYYLSLTSADNHNTHIHLIIRNFYNNSRSRSRTKSRSPLFVRKPNNILGYCIKKRGNHSMPVTINGKQSPKLIVSTMLKQINNFK
jgi:hypothetical protein